MHYGYSTIWLFSPLKEMCYSIELSPTAAPLVKFIWNLMKSIRVLFTGNS